MLIKLTLELLHNIPTTTVIKMYSEHEEGGNRRNHTGCEQCKKSKDKDDTTTNSSEQLKTKSFETSAIERTEEGNDGTHNSVNDSAAPESSKASEEQLTVETEGEGDINIAKARSLEQQSGALSVSHIRLPENAQVGREHQSQLSEYGKQTSGGLGTATGHGITVSPSNLFMVCDETVDPVFNNTVI